MTPLEHLTLEDLCRDATRLLAQHTLLHTQPDGRVTGAPDPRTVRYYTTLGLVDRPTIVDREARYGWRQVLQVLAIKALQHTGLPLARIQERLYARSEAELEAILRAVTERVPPVPAPVPSTLWREVVLEPGLRLSIGESWSASGDLDSLLSRIRAALAAPPPAQGGQAHETR